MTNITIKYYNVFISKNDQLTNIDFGDYLDHVRSIPSNERQQEDIILKLMKHPDEMSYGSDRAFTIANYRVRKPKQGEKKTEEYLEINFDVFEQTNCFYQHTERLFICEYNYYGAKIKDIKNYLEKFLPKVENEGDDKWNIKFIELTPEHTIQDITRARDIGNLEIKLDLTSTQVDFFRSNLRDRQNFVDNLNEEDILEEQVYDYIDTTFTEMLRTRNLFGGGVRDILFSKGKNWRNNPFNLEAVKALLCYIDVDSELFMNIKVSYTSEDGIKYNNIDLKHSKVLSKPIVVNGDSWEIITSDIERYFYELSNRTGAGNARNHHIQHHIRVNDYPFIRPLVTIS
ncbi:hypothetical protein MHH85_11165 [Viridibacillus sp. FSL E2-0187]|uniref:hypothetical protein n=1 Tax=Viridibacillus sp. FSL E2-0187 TaxID=2921362 RepID=UPI0030FC5B26